VKKSITGFDKKHLGAKVMGSFLYTIARLENEGVMFSEICTVVASEEGRRWVEQRFGLEVMPKAIGRHLAHLAGWEFRDTMVGLMRMFGGWPELVSSESSIFRRAIIRLCRFALSRMKSDGRATTQKSKSHGISLL
jgi:hypothetical protein